MDKCNKAIAVFWQSRRIVGKTWDISPRIAHWLYTAVVRPMLVYAAVVWCPRVELNTARTMLERIQRLACLAICWPHTHHPHCSYGNFARSTTS